MQEEKTTTSQIFKKYPFLAGLIKQTGWKANARVRISFKIDEPLDISAPFHDGCCRYTSIGTLNNGSLKVSSHYAGCYDTILNNPQEVGGIGMDNKQVKENSFYAIADSFEYWRSRSIIVYLRSQDLKELEAV